MPKSSLILLLPFFSIIWACKMNIYHPFAAAFAPDSWVRTSKTNVSFVGRVKADDGIAELVSQIIGFGDDQSFDLFFRFSFSLLLEISCDLASTASRPMSGRGTTLL